MFLVYILIILYLYCNFFYISCQTNFYNKIIFWINSSSFFLASQGQYTLKICSLIVFVLHKKLDISFRNTKSHCFYSFSIFWLLSYMMLCNIKAAVINNKLSINFYSTCSSYRNKFAQNICIGLYVILITKHIKIKLLFSIHFK